MKPFSILMIRLLGLYLFLKTLFSVLPALLGPNVGEFWSADLRPVLLATVAVPMVGGVLLWCSAGRLAERLHGAWGARGAAGPSILDGVLVRAGTFAFGPFVVARHIGMRGGAISAP